MGLRHGDLRLPRSADDPRHLHPRRHLASGDHRHRIRRGSRRSRRRSPRSTSRSRPTARRFWSPASPTLPTAIVRYDPASGDVRDAQALARRSRSTPAISRFPTPVEFPTENGLTAHALPLSSAGTRTSSRRKASCRRCSCRATADRPAPPRPRSSLPLAVLDVARICRPRRQLRRQHRLRPPLPAAAERHLGHRRRRRPRQRRAAI